MGQCSLASLKKRLSDCLKSRILSAILFTSLSSYSLNSFIWETPEARRKANHDINRMTAEKITASEASMNKLRDIMMSILKDMKKAYDSKPSDIDTSQLTEMISAMFEQVPG